MSRSSNEETVTAYYRDQMPDAVKAALAVALHDLYNGPASADDLVSEGLPVVGFESACKALADWWQGTDTELWLDTDADYVMTSEPEAWTDDGGETIDPCWESILHFDSRATSRLVFGALADYV